MAQLTDKERKQLVAEYVDCQSYNAVAKKYKISATTVKKWVLQDTATVEKCEQKKEENTQSVLEHFETLKEEKKELLSLLIETTRDKLKDPSNSDYRYISVKDNMIGYGTLLDKELKIKEIKLQESNPNKTNDNILNIATLINNPIPTRNESILDE